MQAQDDTTANTNRRNTAKYCANFYVLTCRYPCLPCLTYKEEFLRAAVRPDKCIRSPGPYEACRTLANKSASGTVQLSTLCLTASAGYALCEMKRKYPACLHTGHMGSGLCCPQSCCRSSPVRCHMHRSLGYFWWEKLLGSIVWSSGCLNPKSKTNSMTTKIKHMMLEKC